MIKQRLKAKFTSVLRDIIGGARDIEKLKAK